MNKPMIEVKNFRKLYGDYVAVDTISFTVYRGEILACWDQISGKTSTLESLEGLRPPSGGTLRVAGVDPRPRPTSCATSSACNCNRPVCPPASPLTKP